MSDIPYKKKYKILIDAEELGFFGVKDIRIIYSKVILIAQKGIYGDVLAQNEIKETLYTNKKGVIEYSNVVLYSISFMFVEIHEINSINIFSVNNYFYNQNKSELIISILNNKKA